MNKILSITWKDVYTTFSDRSLLLIMFATPLLISTIVAFVFGGDAEGTFSDLPVAIVNIDTAQGEDTSYSSNLVSMFTGTSAEDENEGPACPLVAPVEETNGSRSLGSLVQSTVFDTVEEARSGVNRGEFVAAVIIHDGFSAAMAPRIGTPRMEAPAENLVEVYGSVGSPISASIVRAIVESYVDSIQTGNFAVEATINTLISTNPIAAMRLQNNEEVGAVFACGFGGALGTVQINPVSIYDGGESLSGFAQILVVIGSAQAVFFALFSGQFGVLSIIEERRQGTLQRMVVSPTTRGQILSGKLGGTFLVVVFQLVVLLLTLTLVASLVSGSPVFIWGTNVAGILAMVLALGIAVCGLGVLMAGILKTPEQAGSVGSIINILLAVAGGTFGFFVPSPIREFSLVYWGAQGFDTLSRGGSDITLNLAVLVAQGVVFFAIGLMLFNRQRNI